MTEVYFSFLPTVDISASCLLGTILSDETRYEAHTKWVTMETEMPGKKIKKILLSFYLFCYKTQSLYIICISIRKIMKQTTAETTTRRMIKNFSANAFVVTLMLMKTSDFLAFRTLNPISRHLEILFEFIVIFVPLVQLIVCRE